MNEKINWGISAIKKKKLLIQTTILNNLKYFEWKKLRLKRLYIIWLHLYNILDKAKLYGWMRQVFGLMVTMPVKTLTSHIRVPGLDTARQLPIPAPYQCKL